MEHSHCWACVTTHCQQRYPCPIEYCPNGCGFSMHQCKLDEHQRNTCPEALTPCPNTYYGCGNVMKRRKILTHIENCPASIVMCKFSHQRREEPDLGWITLPGGSMNTDEDLIDRKLLEGDLEVWRTDKLQISSIQDKGTLSVPMKESNEINKESVPSLSYAVDIGVMNKMYWVGKKRFTAEVAGLSRRACIDATIPEYDPYFTSSRRRAHSQGYRACTFMCNQTVRRNEFSAHFKSLHMDIHLGELTRRCPMRVYGCKHGLLDKTPKLKGSCLDYDKQTDCFQYNPPSAITQSLPGYSGSYSAEIQKRQELALYGYDEFEEESFDVLCQLPAEVLEVICGCLDSQSLWVLSQVNHYLRQVCLNLVKRYGMVYTVWEQNKIREWVPGPTLWSYSKVFTGLSNWRYTSEPSIAAHMMSCDYMKVEVKPYTTERVLLVYPTDSPRR